MNRQPKYKVGDKVYVFTQYTTHPKISRHTIRAIQHDVAIDSDGTDVTIKYGIEEYGDVYYELQICGTTDADVYRYIDKYYDNKIKKINEEKQEIINTFKDR